MSEYTEVEQPFLHQLQALSWDVIGQEQQIPSDPILNLGRLGGAHKIISLLWLGHVVRQRHAE